MLLAAVVLLLAPATWGQTSDARVKAEYLLNLAEFVEWPAGAFADRTAPLVVGVVGAAAVLGELHALEVRRVAGRVVEIRTFTWEELADKRAAIDQELRTCHIMFIGQDETRALPVVFKKIRGASVLTAGESSGFSRQYFAEHMCGVIDFFNVGGALAVEINLDAAQRARLKVSSQLLRLVKVVYPEDAPPQSAK